MIPTSDLGLLLYNCTGARTKLDNVRLGMQRLGLNIGVLTETWFKEGTPFPKECISVSTANVSGRTRGFGGTCFYIPERKMREKARTICVDQKNGRFSIMQIDELIIAAVYLSPLASVEECEEVMQFVVTQIQKSKCASAIIAGDFNLRHESIGSAFSCKRGESLIPIIQGSGFACKNDGKPTHRREGWTSSLLDLYFTRNVSSESAVPADDLYLGKSHHIPVILKTNLKIQEKKKGSKQRFNLENARIKENKLNYVMQTRESLTAIEKKIGELSLNVRSGQLSLTQPELSARIDKIDSELNKSLFESARANFGIIRPKLIQEKPIDSEYSNGLFDNLQIAHRNSQHEKMETISKTLAEERRVIRKEKFREYCMETCNLPKGQQISRIARMSRAMASKGEGTLNEDTATLEAAVTHFSGIFNSIRPSRHEGFEWNKTGNEAWNLADSIFSQKNVFASILTAPTRKAGGESGVINELFLLCDRMALTNCLRGFFSLCFSTGLVPTSWKKAIIVPVPKKGDMSDIANYRPISLLEVSRKLFEKCLLNHLLEEMSSGKLKKLSEEQGGFRAGRSTLDQCAILEELMKATRKKWKCQPVVVFLDIKAAYDSVNRNILFNKCTQIGMHSQIVESLRQLFDFNNGCIQIGAAKSRSFKMYAGVQQGSLLSPLLYSIFLDGIRDKLQKGPGLVFQKRPNNVKEMLQRPIQINALLYADDIAIIGKDTKDVQKLLDLAQEFASQNTFKFNPAKCVWIGEHHENSLTIEETRLRRVNTFEYLGVSFDKKGINAKAQISRTISNARKIYFVLKRIGFSGHGFSINSNLLLYKSIIRPRMEYGLAILKLNKGNLKYLEASQHAIICGAFSVGINTSRTALRVLGRVEPMETRVNILSERFRIRVIRLTGLGKSFLGLVLWLLENAWGIESTFTLQESKSDYVLTPVAAPTDIEANKLARSIYLLKANLKDLQHTKEKQKALSPIWELETSTIRRNLCTNRLDTPTRMTILLFLLKKHPHQGNRCLKDKSPLSTLHLTQCNSSNWQACSIRIQAIFKGPRNTQKKLKFTEAPIDGYYIPVLISLGMKEQCHGRARKILLIIANSIKTSVRKCLTGNY